MAQPQTNPSPARRLLTRGERLGWIFRDRNLFRRTFADPAPIPQDVPPHVIERSRLTTQKFGRNLGITVGGTIAAFIVLSCCAGIGGETANAAVALMVVALLAGGAATAAVIYFNVQARDAVDQSRAELRRQYDAALANWQERKAFFERNELTRVDQMLEWGAATVPRGTRRIDIIGGNLWGWEAFLTVFGSSMLSTRGALTVVDLSEEGVAEELVALAADVALPTDVQRLPAEIATSDILVGLNAEQIIDVITEALYGDAETASRSDRMMDSRILGDVCGALGGHLSMARIAAALHVLLGESGQSDVLSYDERDRIEALHTDEWRKQAHNHVRRIEAFLHPITNLGVQAQIRPEAQLNCTMLTSGGSSAWVELLGDLIIQSMTRRISKRPDSSRTVVVTGADRVQRRYLEKLSDVCERRDVRLVYVFRHLRDSSLQVLGGGSVGFMRLGNHEEATRAADFIGRHHKFVLSQLTRTVGGNESHTEGTSETSGYNESTNRGWGAGGRHGGSSRGTSRTWGSTSSVAQGTNWSNATSEQRVYEYAVEPRTIQDLPDYAMLLVASHPSGPVLSAVECNPEISLLPRLTMEPLPVEEMPMHPAVTGQQPTQQVSVSGFQPARNPQAMPHPQGHQLPPGVGQPQLPPPGYPPQPYPRSGPPYPPQNPR